MKVFKDTLETPPVDAVFKDTLVLEQKIVEPYKAAVYKTVLISSAVPATYEVTPVVKRVVVSPPVPRKYEDVVTVEMSLQEARDLLEFATYGLQKLGLGGAFRPVTKGQVTTLRAFCDQMQRKVAP